MLLLKPPRNHLLRSSQAIIQPLYLTIKLTAGTDLAFECTVARADWHEEKQLFVVACKYPRQRIFQNEYESLINDPAWKRTELPS